MTQLLSSRMELCHHTSIDDGSIPVTLVYLCSIEKEFNH